MSILGDIAAELAQKPLQKEIDDLSKRCEELRNALDWISVNGPDDAFELRQYANAALAKDKGGAV